jgi:hypothetical protein
MLHYQRIGQDRAAERTGFLADGQRGLLGLTSRTVLVVLRT